VLSSPHEIIKLKWLCGFGVEEILALSRPTTNATIDIGRQLGKANQLNLGKLGRFFVSKYGNFMYFCNV